MPRGLPGAALMISMNARPHWSRSPPSRDPVSRIITRPMDNFCARTRLSWTGPFHLFEESE